MPCTTALFRRVLIVAALAGAACPTAAFAAPTDARKTSSGHQAGANDRTYVPVEAFDLLLKNAANGVLMRGDEFRKLTEQARRAAAKMKSAPAGITIKSVTYRARLRDDQILMTAEIAFQRFDTGWRTVQLPIGTMRVEEATLNGKPAAIGRDSASGGALTLFDEKTRDGKLLLKLSTPVHRVGADRVAVVELVGSPVATFRFTAPAGQMLSVDDADVKRPAADNAPAEYALGVGGRRTLRLRIGDGKQSRPGDPLLLATTNAGLIVRPAGADWSAETTIEAVGKTLDRVEFTVPGKLTITHAEADGMADWQWKPAADAEAPATVLLTFQRPIRGRRVIRLRGMMGERSSAFWSVPKLILKGADSHVGRLTVSHFDDVRLRVDEYDGVRLMQNPVIKKPGPRNPLSPASARSLSFQVWRENFELTLNTTAYKPRVTAKTAAAITVADDGVHLSYSAVIESQRTRPKEIMLTLPAEWPVTSIIVDGKPARWTAPPVEANVQHLRIETPAASGVLPRPGNVSTPTTARVSILVTARRALEFPEDEKGTADFRIPEIRLPLADSVQGAIAILADNAFDITVEKTAGLRPAANELPGQQFGFRYRATSKQASWYAGDVKVTRKPPRIAIRTLAYTRLDPTALRTYLEVEFDITGSGVPKLNVTLPAAVSDRLRFRMIGGAGRITEQTAAAPADGRRVWTLTFDRRVAGVGTLAVAVESDRQQSVKSGQAFLAQTLLVPAAERQSGFVVIEAGDDQRLEIATRDAAPAAGDAGKQPGLPLTEIDPVELPVFAHHPGVSRYVPRRRIVAAYRYIVPGYRVAISEERLSGPSVPAVICKKNTIESTLSATGEFQHRAVFELKTGGVQGLKIKLPGDSQPWATLLNRQPVEVRKEADGFFIPLSRYAHATVVLELFYQTNVKLRGVGHVGQQSPRLSVVRGTGQESPLEILDRTWTLYTPPELQVVDSAGLFQPTEPLEGSSLLGQFRRAFAMESFSTLGGRLFAALLLGGVVVLITICVNRYGAGGMAAVASILFILGVAIMIPMVLSTARSKHDSKSGRKSAPASEFFDVPAVRHGKRSEKGDFEDLASKPATKAPEMPRSAKKTARTRDEKPKDSVVLGGKAGGQKKIPQMALVGDAASLPVQRPQPPTARLSLAIQFEPPASHDATVFRYYGSAVDTESDSAGDQLELVTESYNDGVMYRICVAAGVVLLFWLLKSRSLRLRGTLAAIAVAVPPALVAFTPVLWHVFLDGLFCGGVIGCLLWILRGAVVHYSHRETPAKKSPLNRRSAVTTTALLLLLVLCVVQTASAQSSPNGVPGARRPRSVSTDMGLQIPNDTTTTRERKPSEVRMQDSTEDLWCGGDAPPARETSQPQGTPRSPGRTIPSPPNKPSPLIPIRPNTVVIPYDDATDPLTAKRVLVPYKEFARLWKLAHPENSIAAPGPVDGLVVQALHTADVKPGAAPGRETLVVKSRIVLYNFRDRRVQLPVPIGNVAFQTAKLDGQPATLVVKHAAKSGASQQEISLPTAGLHVLDLEFHVPVERFGAGGRVTIPLQKVAAGRMSITLPKSGLHVEIDGQTGAYRRQKNGGKETIDFSVDRGGALRIHWAPADQRGPVANILHADLTTNLEVDDAGVHQRTQIRVDVRRGQLADVTFDIPASFKLKRLSGTDVAGSQTERKANGTRLRVFLRRPVTSATHIAFELFRPLTFTIDDSQVEAAAIQVDGVSRRAETIRVTAGPQFEVRTADRKGFSQTNFVGGRSTTPRNGSGRTAIALKTTQRDVQLKLNVKRREMQTAVTASHTIAVGNRDVRVTSRLTFDLKGTPRSKISLLMPEKFAVERIDGAQIAEWSSGEELLFLQLKTPQSGVVQVTISGTRARDLESDSVALGLPAPTMATTMSSQVAVRLATGIDATVTRSAGWTEILAGRLPPELVKADSRPVRFAYRSDSTEPSSITLKLTRVSPVVSAEAVTLIRVTDVAVYQTVVMKFAGLMNAADPIAFTTPGWLAERLDFSVSPGVRVRRAGGPELPNGRVRWVVRPDAIPGGNVVVVGTAALPSPRSAANKVRAPVLDFQIRETGDNGPAFVSLKRQQHVAVLANHANGKIEAEKPKTLVTVSQTGLPKSIQFDPEMATIIAQAVARVKLAPSSAEPVWNLRKLVAQKGAAAVVNLAELTTVVERDGTWRCRAEYSVKNQTRQFLALVLPKESRVLSVVVRGRASRTVDIKRKDATYALIPLPKSGEADLALGVRVILAGTLSGGPLSRNVRLQASKIDLPAPRVVTREEAAEFGIPVARTKWSVHFPADFDIDPETDADVTNVTPATVGEQSDYEELTILREYNELYRVLSSSDSGSKKKQAALSNLQRLKPQIEQLQQRRQFTRPRDDLARPPENAPGKRQLIAEREKFQGNWIRVESLHRGFGKKEPDAPQSLQLLNPQEQQAAVQKQARVLLNTNAGAITPDKNRRPMSGVPHKATDSEFKTGTIVGLGYPTKQGNQQGQRGPFGGRGEGKGDPQQNVPPGQPARDFNLGLVDAGVEDGKEMKQAARLTEGIMSLEFDFVVPAESRVLTFTKPGGGPKLQLKVRPQRTRQTAMRLLWSGTWLLLGIAIVVVVTRFGTGSALVKSAPVAAVVVGAIGACLLPMPWSLAGFAVFLIGCVVVTVRKTSVAKPHSAAVGKEGVTTASESRAN